MASRIDITAPATITVLAGDATISSLQTLPPASLAVNDPYPSGTLTVNLVAAGAGTALTASTAAGGTVATQGNTLSLTGTAAQVNAALATLEIIEPTGVTLDTLSLSATDPQALPATTAIAIAVAQPTGPAFANPPATLTLHPNSLTTLAGLTAGDPEATGLAQAGLGAGQTLDLTLQVASGVLFIPGLSSLDGIAATGLGTGEVILTFTADRLAAVNALLAGVEYAAPAATSGLAYALRDLTGPLPFTVTNGNIALDIAGPPGSPGTYAAGSQSLILGAESLTAGSSLAITTITGDLGGITGNGALAIAPDATLNLPYNALSLGGTSLDFGTLTATTFSEGGGILIADGAVFAGPVLLGTGALVKFADTLVGNNAATQADQLAFSLAAGAEITGGGTLLAGNFSESGLITGPGTLLAGGGDTLLIAAGSIGGGAAIDVAGGGVVVLGPVDPLYGIFDATPLTIDSSVTLGFTGGAGLAPIGGGYADTLDQDGGVFVVAGPQAFSGSFTGFTPGDRLIFPGLSNVSLYDVTSTAFDIAGTDSDGNTQTYVIHASYQSGTTPYASTDNEGGAQVSLRGTTPQVFLAGVTVSATAINASAGVAQPVQQLDILLTQPSTLALVATLSVGHGTLTAAGHGPAASLTISAASPTALNNALASLSYTGNGQADILTISSGSGALTGLLATTHINPAGAGTIASGSGVSPTEAQTEIFAMPGLTPVTIATAPGQIVVTALTDFAAPLAANGLTGTAILVDAGATAIFDTAAMVTAAAGITIGDAGGAGSLAILTSAFTVGTGAAPANLVLASNLAAAGSQADIVGALSLAGSLVIGASAAAAVTLSGHLTEAGASIAPAGTLFAYGGATAALGNILDAGSVILTDHASASAGTAAITGLLALGGTTTFAAAAPVSLGAGGTLQTGPDALLLAPALTQTGGTILDAGTLQLGTLVQATGTISLAGGTLTAATLTIAGLLIGSGIVETTVGLTNSGTIIASSGALSLGLAVTNTGTIEIAAMASLDAVHALHGGVIDFTGSNAELTINDLADYATNIGNLTGHDVIDLVGIGSGQVTFSGGSITAHDSAGVIGGFALGTIAGQPAVSIVSDGFGGALITLGDEMPCFARGTRLLTPNGYRPVETLNPGNPIITAAGQRRPVRWVGWRTLDLADAGNARPVLIMPGAFGPGLPARKLRLSPLHAVFTGGVLVPALHLVNGATIRREPAAATTYFHIELDRHDIVLAEALPCETYFDNGNRGPLYQERGVRCPATKPCAALVTAGPRLAAIRRRLHQRALALGFTLTYQPRLRAIAADRTLLPALLLCRGRRIAQLPLPPGSLRVTLLSRGCSPADTDPDSEDRRELALCLHSAKPARGQGPGQAQVQLGAGWHRRGPADAGAWMGNRAELLPPPGTEILQLSFAAVVQSWQPPVDTPRHPL